MSSAAGFFAGMETQEQKAEFLPLGFHRVELMAIEVFISQKDKMPGVRATVKVVETTGGLTAPGRTHVLIHKKNHPAYDYWLGDVRALIAAASDLPMSAVDQNSAGQFVDNFRDIKEGGDFLFDVHVTEGQDKHGKIFTKQVYHSAQEPFYRPTEKEEEEEVPF